jgi:hypothetical protein
MTVEETHEQKFVVIHIDNIEYRLHVDDVTGAQLREFPNPPIGPDRDLWLEVPEGHDRLITDDETVELQDGMHFFSAPARINPGSDAQSR